MDQPSKPLWRSSEPRAETEILAAGAPAVEIERGGEHAVLRRLTLVRTTMDGFWNPGARGGAAKCHFLTLNSVKKCLIDTI